MEQLTESKWFRLLVWLMLGLISLYFVWLLRPLFLDVYRFLKAVLAPFLVAMIISYVLNPVVCMLSDRKVPRSMAVLIIYAVFLTSLAVILINMIPMLIRQLEELNEHLPELTMNAQSLMTNLDSRLLPPGVRTGMNSWFFQMESRLAGGITAFMDNIGNTINILFNVLIVPFLIFYILKDFEVFQRTAVSYLPRVIANQLSCCLRRSTRRLGIMSAGSFWCA